MEGGQTGKTSFIWPVKGSMFFRLRLLLWALGWIVKLWKNISCFFVRQWRYLYGVKLCIGLPIVCPPCFIPSNSSDSQSIAHRPNLVQPIQGKTYEQIDQEDIEIYLLSVRDQEQDVRFSDGGVCLGCVFDPGILGNNCCSEANLFYRLQLPLNPIIRALTQTCRGLDVMP